MGARDGATQAAIPHMIYDACPCAVRTKPQENWWVDYDSRQDHKLILGTHDKDFHLCSLDGRARDRLNRKKVEGAAAAAPSCCCMT